MVITRCDKCGHEMPIIDHNYNTPIKLYKFSNRIDLCKRCYDTLDLWLTQAKRLEDDI